MVDKEYEFKLMLFGSKIRSAIFYQFHLQNPITSTEIAKIIGKSPKTVSHYFKQMYDDGYIRKLEPIMRYIPYELTDEGKRIMEIVLKENWFSHEIERV